MCRFCEQIQPISPIPSDGVRFSQLETSLIALVLDRQVDGSVQLKSGTFNISSLPAELHPLLSKSYLPGVSEAFSKASHEGDYNLALSAGLTLLALYIVVYPSNFPLIGTIYCDRYNVIRPSIYHIHCRYTRIGTRKDFLECSSFYWPNRIAKHQ